MEKVEIQITKGLTEETTEEITLLGHILENADGLKVFSELINHVISENAESILLEKNRSSYSVPNRQRSGANGSLWRVPWPSPLRISRYRSVWLYDTPF